MYKVKNIIHNQKHLTLSDRTYIEQELLQDSTFRSIATTLHKDPTTISKEVRNHIKIVDGKHASGHCIKCKNYQTCDIRGNDLVVTDCQRSSYCNNICKRCWREHPPRFCSLFMPFQCSKPKHAPYACNSCPTEKDCPLSHPIYLAQAAQKVYEKSLVTTRTGINLTQEELHELNDLISPLILKGQPLSHIFAVHASCG